VTRVAVLGVGRAGAQIATDYALGGCSVVWIDDHPEEAMQRIEQALRLLAHHGLAGPAEIERARALLSRRDGPVGSEGRLTLIVESLPERLEVKAELLGELGRHHPEALLASSGALVSPTVLGEAAGAGERMLCAHYTGPPLVTSLVELLAARDTPPRLLQRLVQLLTAIGKHPVVLGREAPGLLGERLRLALLRECLSLVRRGVATHEQVDRAVREGLAREWRLAGPLEEAAIAGPEAVARAARAVFPSLAGEDAVEGLVAQLPEQEDAEPARERVEAALAAGLRAERVDGAQGRR
jgi:3-hydroxyacyl-CoA dehydrogenase